MSAPSSTALPARLRHLAHIVPAIPLAESLMVQTVRDPRDLMHAVAAVLVITAVAQLFGRRPAAARRTAEAGC